MSSSLACYVAAPRMFQAFSRDNLFPYVSWFGVGHGPSNEPYRGYLITFLISLVFTLSGHLNVTSTEFSLFHPQIFQPFWTISKLITTHSSLPQTGYRTDHLDVQACLVLLGQYNLLPCVLHQLTLV